MAISDPVAMGIILSAELLRLSQSFCRLAKRLRYSRHEIARLSDATETFARFYEEFFTTCARDLDGGLDTKPIRRLVAWTEETIDASRRLLKRVRASVANSRNSVLDTIAVHIKRHFSDNEVKCLRLSLGVAKQIMNALTNIRILERCVGQIDQLKVAIARGDRQALEKQLGTTLEALIQTLKTTRSVTSKIEREVVLIVVRNNCRRQRHSIEHHLKEAKIQLFEQYDENSRASDIVPDPKSLLRFARAVDRYIENVLHLPESGRRQRGPSNSLHPTASDSTTRSASRLSSFSSTPALMSPPYPTEDHSNVMDCYAECSQTSTHSEELNDISGFQANFTTFPDLTELLGLVESSPCRSQSNEEGKLDVIHSSRKPQYSSASSTQSFHGAAANSGVHPSPGPIEEEQDASASCEARRETLVDYQNYAYDDVSSEDETERMRRHDDWRSGQERSVSPENF